MIQSIPKELKLTFDEALGWFVDVPHVLSAQQLEAVRSYALKVNIERWRALPHGDNRDKMERGLKALKENKIQQRMGWQKGDLELFKSTKGTKNKLYYHG